MHDEFGAVENALKGIFTISTVLESTVAVALSWAGLPDELRRLGVARAHKKESAVWCVPMCGGSTGAVEEPTPGPHLPEEVGSSRGVRQYIGLRGGARLFPLMYAGRQRDNKQ